MIKREIIILYILIAALFIICGTTKVDADSCDKYSIYVNNSKLDKNVQVQIINGFDYIPINQMQTSLNLTVKEDEASKTINLVSKEKTFKINNGINIEIDGSPSIKLDVPIIIKNNKIYIPLISAVDIFGWQVEVMDDVKCIRIKTINSAVPAGKLLDSELNLQMVKGDSSSSKYPRVAYLTFDDGLDKKITPLILDILKKNDIKATFFILGKTIDKNKDLLKKVIAEGHSIGNHTYTHKKENIYSSAVGLKNEIDKTNAAIYNAVGITTKLFRPPYGGTYIRSDIFKSVLNPYRTILWNIDSMDSKSISITSDEIIDSVINQVKNKKSAVIIMHDSSTHMETVKALPAIIKYLKDNGFVILPIEENSNIYY